jgi:hypothetical protein
LTECGKDTSGLTESEACNTHCLNDGTYVTTASNSGYCQCRDLYEGGCCEESMFILFVYLPSFFMYSIDFTIKV